MAEPQTTTAATYIRCKACGYVMPVGKFVDVCPACGVKAMMFEPCNERFSEKRRRVLNLHLHPAIVHFPQAFAISLLVLVLSMLVASGELYTMLKGAVTLMVWAMPLLVAASFVTGVVDGRTRYKKLSPPFLQTKIRVGVAFFVFSLAAAVVVQTPLWPGLAGTALVAVISAGESACAVVLGIVGVELTGPKLPG